MTTKDYSKLYPTVSIAIPAYNESRDIECLVRGFLSTEYPNLIEIFIADGGSTDGTQDIVTKLSLEDSRIKLIQNPKKNQSHALNLILQQCTGEIFLRADAHSDYAPDYIDRCVEVLLESKAMNVGGAQRFVAKHPFQAGAAIASKSWLGNGGAKYRNDNYNGYADTVYLGCFWKKVLIELSGYCIKATSNEDAELNHRLANYAFDIKQVTNQDSELNQRLINKYNQAVYVSSKIHVWYYPRQTWEDLWIQYLKYGRGRYLTTTKHTNSLQIRSKLPFLVLSTISLTLIIELLFPELGLPIKKITFLCLLLPFVESLRINLKFRQRFFLEIWRGEENEIPSFAVRWFCCGIALLTMPCAHFAGYSYQLFRNRILKIKAW